MRVSRGVGFGAMVVAAGVVLAACGGDGESGTPSAGGSSSSSSGSSSESGGAPAVPEELDPELLLSEPCDLLSADQLDELGLVEYESKTDDLGDEECVWTLSDDETHNHKISISAMGDNANGLDDIYAQREQYKYFEETSINGYPAVFAANYGTPEDGRCGLYVGVTEELSAWVFTQYPVSGEDDPCPIAEETAESVVDTMRG